MEFVLAGLGLGLGAGLAPGPLLALVITTALARGFRAGARVAFSPLVTDAFVITVSLLVVRSLPHRAAAAQGHRGTGVRRPGPAAARRARHLLSPHPWLFWIAVGGPLLLAASANPPRGTPNLRRAGVVSDDSTYGA